MAALTAAAAIALAIQQVASSVPLTVEKSNRLDQLIQDNGRAEQVSNLSYRIPMESALPGSYGAITLDSASVALPAGGSSEYVQGTITPTAACVPIEWTKLAELVDKQPTAVTNAGSTAKQMARAMDTLKVRRDVNLCSGDGQGTLATITGINGNVLTLDSSSFGARGLQKNQYVGIYNGVNLVPSGNAYGNSVQITQVIKTVGQTNTITVDTVPAGTAVGNVIRVDGLSNGGPVFVNGIPSYVNNAQTGYTLNTNRTGNNWLWSNGYDAAQGQVTAPLLRLVLDQIGNAIGEDAITPGSLLIQTSRGQRSQYEQLGETFGVIKFENGKAPEGLDLLFKGQKFTVDGHPVLVNDHAHNGRWDMLLLKAWGKVKWGQGTFWFNQDGQTVFPVIGSNGSPTTSARSFLIDTTNYYVDNFQGQGSLYNLTAASGYTA